MDMIEEIWRDVAGYEDFLQVSNLGRLRKKSHPGTKKKVIEAKILRAQPGSHKLSTTIKAQRIILVVTDIVAQAFIPLPPECSIDDMIPITVNARFDFRVDNIRWVRKSEVNLYTRRLISEPPPKTKNKPGPKPKEQPQPKPVRRKPSIVQLRQNGEYVRRYMNINELLSVHPTWEKDVVLDCLDEYILSAYGWRLLYESDYEKSEDFLKNF